MECLNFQRFYRSLSLSLSVSLSLSLCGNVFSFLSLLLFLSFSVSHSSLLPFFPPFVISPTSKRGIYGNEKTKLVI